MSACNCKKYETPSNDDGFQEWCSKLVRAYELAEIEADAEAMRSIRSDAYTFLNYSVLEHARVINPAASDNPEITGMLFDLIHGLSGCGREPAHHVRVTWTRVRGKLDKLCARGAS